MDENKDQNYSLLNETNNSKGLNLGIAHAKTFAKYIMLGYAAIVITFGVHYYFLYKPEWKSYIFLKHASLSPFYLIAAFLEFFKLLKRGCYIIADNISVLINNIWTNYLMPFLTVFFEKLFLVLGYLKDIFVVCYEKIIVPIFNKLYEFLVVIKDSCMSVINFFCDEFYAFLSFLKSLVVMLFDKIIIPMFNKLYEFIVMIKDAFMPTMKLLLDKLIVFSSSFYRNILIPLKDFVVMLLNKLGDLIGPLVSKLYDIIFDILIIIGDVFNRVSNFFCGKLVKLLTMCWDVIVILFNKLISPVFEAIANVFSVVSTFLREKCLALLFALKDLLMICMRVVAPIFNLIKNFFVDNYDVVKNIIIKIVSNIMSNMYLFTVTLKDGIYENVIYLLKFFGLQ